MVQWIIPPVARLIEPFPVPEFYVDSVGAIELIGGCVRLYFCVDQLPLEAGNAPAQRIMVLKLVRPVAAIPEAIARLAQCLVTERTPGIVPSQTVPRLVR